MTAPHPEKIHKYEITDLLGEGAMGVVYRARDSVLQRFVAIKVMTVGIARDPDLRERFLREARAAGSLQHPNIVTIYDFGEFENQLFIAMQYIEGTDLTDVIGGTEPLPLHAKVDIVLDVLNGLAYAHRRGIIHRDIKPANIRLSSEGRAHIMDFGIARLSKSSMTRSGVLIGTPDYMSPEQVTGAELTPGSDIFAVGTVFYELLTNTKPFKAETLHSVMFKIVSEDPRAMAEVIPGLPAALQTIVSKALAKNPQRRYPGAEPMIEDLTAFRLAMSAGGNPTIVVRRTPLRSPSLTEGDPLQPRRRTSPLLLAVSGLAAATAIGAFAWLGTRSARESSRSDRSAIPPSVLPGSTSARATPGMETSPRQPSVGQQPSGPVATSVSAPALRAEAQRAERLRTDSMVASIRATAIDARQRAEQAGAKPADLAQGDQLMRTGDMSARQARAPEAISRYAGAASAWSAANQRVLASRLSAVSSGPAASVAAPASPVPVTSTAVTPAEKPAQAEPTRDPRPEIESLIAAFAKALESLSIADLKRAYPGMTAAQQTGWNQFFGSVRQLRADLDIAKLDVNGSTAEARVTGTYIYDGKNGKQDRQPVSFIATAVHDDSGWHLTAMH